MRSAQVMLRVKSNIALLQRFGCLHVCIVLARLINVFYVLSSLAMMMASAISAIRLPLLIAMLRMRL